LALLGAPGRLAGEALRQMGPPRHPVPREEPGVRPQLQNSRGIRGDGLARRRGDSPRVARRQGRPTTKPMKPVRVGHWSPVPLDLSDEFHFTFLSTSSTPPSHLQAIFFDVYAPSQLRPFISPLLSHVIPCCYRGGPRPSCERSCKPIRRAPLGLTRSARPSAVLNSPDDRPRSLRSDVSSLLCVVSFPPA
jgi:hypothetical protein